MPRGRKARSQLEAVMPVSPLPLPTLDPALEDVRLRAAAARIHTPPPKTVLINTLSRRELQREHEVLTAALLEEARELGKHSFWFFFTHNLFPDVWEQHYTEDFHGSVAQILQDLQPGDNQMFVLPREHRKTYLVLVGFSLWLITLDPNIRIMLIGAKEATSVKWATMIRNAFIRGTPAFKRFQQVYPDFVIESSGKGLLQAKQFIHPRRTKALADPTIYATYLGVTGAGARADVQIFDDPYERKNVSNPEQSAKSLSQTLDLFPLVEVAEGASYRMRIFNVTRWAYHDPTGALIGEQHGLTFDAEDVPPFKAMVRHAFEIPDTLCELCPKHVVQQFPHGHPDVEKGSPIMFPVITREGLMKRFAEYAADPNRGESLWWHQYMNVCLSPKDQKIQAEWCQLVAPFPYFSVSKRKVLCIDAADKDFATETGGDWMVALFGEFDDNGRLLLVYGLRSREWTRAQFQDRILTWCRSTNWWPHIVAKEKFGDSGGTFLSDLGRRFAELQKVPHLKAVMRPGSDQGSGFMKKLDWMLQALQGPLERGEIIYGRDFPQEIRKQGEYEMTHMGQTKFDDVADTMALMMAEGVRLAEPRQDARPLVYAPLAPPLDLYDPFGSRPVAMGPSQTPLQQALQSPSLMGVGVDLVESWARTIDPKLPRVKLDL